MPRPLKDPRDYKPTGRPRKNPPPDAVARILAYSKEGASLKGIANQFGVGIETFNRWREEDTAIQRAIDEGREHEHKELFNSLFKAAQKGNVTAAIFLLKTRHGYREGDQSDLANKVSINFTLPGALPLDQFARVIEHEPTNRTEPVSEKTVAAARRT